MPLIDLLQQVGLSKYEAEAYSTLLTHGALTGYEVGKHSHVPLSRSYEILERLTQKGLALLQPGDPPRYSAQEPGQFLGELRSTMEETLEQLAAGLSTLPHPDVSGEFWVLRGRQNILARAHAMIASTRQMLAISIAPEDETALVDALSLSREKGCSVFQPSGQASSLLLLLVDQREALIGMLAPDASCQAIVSANEALLASLRGFFAHQQFSWAAPTPAPARTPEPLASEADSDWLDWEDRKQRRLWTQSTNHRVA